MAKKEYDNLNDMVNAVLERKLPTGHSHLALVLINEQGVAISEVGVPTTTLVADLEHPERPIAGGMLMHLYEGVRQVFSEA